MGDFEKWKAKYLGYVDKIIKYIPYKRVGEWKEFFLDPIAVVSKGPSTVMERFKDLMFIQILGIFIALLGQVVPMLVLSIFNPLNILVLALMFGIYIVCIILTPIIYTAYYWFEHRIARLLGGTADFKTHFNATVLPMLALTVILLPFSIATIPLTWLAYIPFVSCCIMPILLPLSLFSMGLWLYSIYQKFLVLRHVHNLSDLRTVGVILLPLLIIMALVALVVLLFFAVTYLQII